MVLVTVNRRENFGDGLRQICCAIDELARQQPDVAFVYPVHLNPQVREPAYRWLAKQPNVHLCEPTTYPEFIWLMDRATLILTDSGGVQEEAPTLGRPVLVLRDTSERPEVLESGASELVGVDAERIVEQVQLLLRDPAAYARRQVVRNPYGDGHAAQRIVDLVVRQAWQAAYPTELPPGASLRRAA
jgi:UDP-N-acetylglucosamine 2-epimerase (non-hydrolysing)